MTYHSPLTVQDAKSQLLGAPNPAMSIEDAKRQLMAPVSLPMTIADAKRSLLDRDIVESSLNAISLADSKRESLAVATQDKLARVTPAQPGANKSLLTDAQSDSFLGGAANIALAGTGGLATLVGTAITFVPALGNQIDAIGIDPAEYDIAKTITDKLAVNEQLSEGEQAYYEQEKDGNMATIANIQKKSEFINAIKVGVESVNSWQNRAKQNIAMKEVGDTAGVAADEFSKGNYLAGFGTFLDGVYNLATDNPVAAMELTANSIPQMLALAWKALPAITALAVDNTTSSLDSFKEEYGREATTEERGLAALLSTLSAGADLLGAKFAFGGTKLLQSLPKAATAMGMKVPSATLSAAGKAITKVTGSTIGKVTKPVSTAAVEGVTEGTQNLLDQLAAKQDLSKVSGKDIITDSIVGAVSGAQLASPTAVGALGKPLSNITNKARKSINENATKVVEKAKEKGIGATAEVIQKAKDTNNPELGLNAIKRATFNTVSIEDQKQYIDDYFDFMDSFATVVAESNDPAMKEKLDGYNNEIDKIIDVYNNKKNKTSVNDAVTVLNDTGADSAAHKDAASTIVNKISTSATLPNAVINEVLGSDSKFRDVATPAQVKVVEDYKNFRNKVDKVSGDKPKGMEQVALDIEKGTSKFPGITSQLKKIKVAIVKKDTKAIKQVIDSISGFIESQKLKLDPKNKEGQFLNNKTNKLEPHRPNLVSRIKEEIAALEATLTQIDNITKDIKTPAATKAKPKVAKESGKKSTKKESNQPLKSGDNGTSINIDDEVKELKELYTEGDYINTSDGSMSPWLLASGRIVMTGQDHVGYANDLGANSYGEFSRKTGAIRFSYFTNGKGKLSVVAQIYEGQPLSTNQIESIKKLLSITDNSELAVGVSKSSKKTDIENPQYKIVDVNELQGIFDKTSVVGSATKLTSSSKPKPTTLKIVDAFELDAKDNPIALVENNKAILAEIIAGKTKEEKDILREEYTKLYAQVKLVKKVGRELAKVALTEALNNIVITREGEFNKLTAAEELDVLDNKLDVLKDIWKECK